MVFVTYGPDHPILHIGMKSYVPSLAAFRFSQLEDFNSVPFKELSLNKDHLIPNQNPSLKTSHSQLLHSAITVVHPIPKHIAPALFVSQSLLLSVFNVQHLRIVFPIVFVLENKFQVSSSRWSFGLHPICLYFSKALFWTFIILKVLMHLLHEYTRWLWSKCFKCKA